MSDEALRLATVLFNTMNRVFDQVLIIPANRDYFLASDQELSVEAVKLIQKKPFQNEYFNEFYLKDKILRYRSDHTMNALLKMNVVNRDYEPVVYLQQLILWLSYFKIDYRLFLIIPGVILLIFMVLLTE